ncbi:MAG: sigma factor-like helix-turn-helix DNA-binding protein [Terracidiphilus sp.]
MSAALLLPTIWAASNPDVAWQEEARLKVEQRAAQLAKKTAKAPDAEPVTSLAFYRKHTESMLRRYLYASMQVGRAPSILGDPVGRGWASSRPIRTFEDAVIFVLDLEKCLDTLSSLDRQLLSRIVLQEYTQAEAATLIGMSVRAISYKLPEALDRLTEKLLASGLLVLPH